MITLHFLKQWFKCTALAVLAVFIELGAITNGWWQALALAITGVVYLLITGGMFQEWRNQQAGNGAYRYTILK